VGKLQLTFTGSFDKKIKLGNAHFGDHIPVPETTILLADTLLEELSVSRRGLRMRSSRQTSRSSEQEIQLDGF